MGTTRTVTEATLGRAKAALEAHVSKLKQKGKAEADFVNDPKWRLLDGDFRQLLARIRKLDSVDARNAEVVKRKAERDSAESE